jgi:hypothetical protein
MSPYRLGFVALPMALCVTGCLSLNSPSAQRQLQIVSAGQTGCKPDDNVISNAQRYGSSGTWNVTCNNKVYLCSATRSVENTHCTPVAQ